MTTDPLTCITPECHGRPWFPRPSAHVVRVRCRSCGAAGPWKSTEDEARAAWEAMRPLAWSPFDRNAIPASPEAGEDTAFLVNLSNGEQAVAYRDFDGNWRGVETEVELGELFAGATVTHFRPLPAPPDARAALDKAPGES